MELRFRQATKTVFYMSWGYEIKDPLPPSSDLSETMNSDPHLHSGNKNVPAAPYSNKRHTP